MLLVDPLGTAAQAGAFEALLEVGMGPGEYMYVYSVAYYSWLGKSPADGPSFTLVGDDGDNQGRQVGQDEFDVREERREMVLLSTV